MTGTGLPTVEELMKPIKINSFGVSGFDLQPVRYILRPHRPFTPEYELLYLKSHKLATNFFDKTQENVVLQMTTNKCIENSCPRVNTMEEHIDKMYLDILKKKISIGPTLLPQDDKLNKTYRSQLSYGEEEAVTGKQVPYKETGSAPSLLKRKPQSALYASVRSSGYGKPSSPFKTFSTLEKKTSKGMKSKNLRSIPTSNQTRKKEILSGTKLIKPAASGRPAPQTESCLTPEKSVHPAETESCVQSRNDSSGRHGGTKETELIMFKRVQEAEEKWRGAQALIDQIKVTFSEKEKELENKMEELKRQQEKELFKLNQDNYILQAKDSSGRHGGTKETELIMFKRVQEAEEKWRGAQALIDQIKVTFSEKEKELENKMEELKRQQEKELFKLNQDNYILQAKENERLYNQVKDLQEQNKKNEERMFKENQSLFSELASLKEQMHQSHFLPQVAETSEPSGNWNFTDLLTELRVAQKEKISSLEDIKRLKQDKQALEVDLEKMNKERSRPRIRLLTPQELLDRDAVRLKEANEEIEKLRLEVKKLKAESGNPSLQQKIHLKDRAADAKKIQDLERQVCIQVSV
ncbi:hypothetical protein MUG91_G503n2 [Manis pentadactyla]|nr:hypothetical protein MUG91_G503n2 [Manis pentadactyla]